MRAKAFRWSSCGFGFVPASQEREERSRWVLECSVIWQKAWKQPKISNELPYILPPAPLHPLVSIRLGLAGPKHPSTEPWFGFAGPKHPSKMLWLDLASPKHLPKELWFLREELVALIASKWSIHSKDPSHSLLFQPQFSPETTQNSLPQPNPPFCPALTVHANESSEKAAN